MSADTIDWKTKLFQILECFGYCEGTWYEREWDSFGLTPEEIHIIKQEYAQWEKEHSKYDSFGKARR